MYIYIFIHTQYTILFTDIPLEQTLKICLDTLYNDDQIGKPPVPENLLKKLLMKATPDVEFSCNNPMQLTRILMLAVLRSCTYAAALSGEGASGNDEESRFS